METLLTGIDAVQVHFQPEQLVLLNWLLGFLMFGVALDIRISDFRYLLEHPRTAVTGIVSQLILLPILSLVLIWLLRPAPSIALGMLLVGVCPGGNVSNFMSALARANAALSVLLTAFSTLLAILSTPFLFNTLSWYTPGTEKLRQYIYVDPVDMMSSIALLVVLPLSLGMLVRHFLPHLADKIQKPVRLLSLMIFLGFVVVAIIGNWDNIKTHVLKVFFAVGIHNVLALGMGYWVARANQCKEEDCRTISIETGIQNSGLALILIFNFFHGLGGLAMVAAWWGIWHLITGFGLAIYWSKGKLV